MKTRKRYSVDKSLLHLWLDSYETWSDMRDLENRNGMRWLTHECDDGRCVVSHRLVGEVLPEHRFEKYIENAN